VKDAPAIPAMVRQEEPGERGCQAHHDVVDAERPHGEQQHRAAPVAVGEVAEQRRAHELHHRVDEREPAAVDRRLVHGVAGQLHEQPRQHRQDQPEADDVDHTVMTMNERACRPVGSLLFASPARKCAAARTPCRGG
jgi:hypothetical protein